MQIKSAHLLHLGHSMYSEEEHWNKSAKSVVMLTLLLTIFFLSACGRKGGDSLTGSQSDAISYLPEYLPLEQDETSVLNIVIEHGQALYLICSLDEDGATDSVIRICSLIDNSVTDCPLSLSSKESLNKYTLDEKGGIYAVLSSWHTDESGAEGGHEEYLLVSFDAEGKELFRQNITAQIKEEEYYSVSRISLDGQGRLYVFGGSRIWLYSADGAYQGAVDLSEQGYSWFTSAGTDRKGEMYISSFRQNGYELTKIDFDTKSLGPSYHNFYEKNNSYLFGKGIQKDFLISDGTSVYEYDLEDQSLFLLFQWMDYDIDGTYLQNICAVPGGGIAASGKDPSTDEYFLLRLSDASGSMSERDTSGIVSDAPSLNSAENPVPKKQELVLASLSLKNDPFLKKAVVDFNKTSDQYHITLKEYGTPIDTQGDRYERWTMEEWLNAVTKLNADLTSQNCPDIVDISDINIDELAKKNVFLDIQSFLDHSAVISSGDYPDNVLAGCTYHGRLLGIPKFISVATVMGHASDLGEESGWTLEEMIAYANAHPDAELFEDATKSDILNYCMTFYESYFVDLAEKKCDFDSSAFKQLLEFVNGFPDQKTQQSGEFVSPPVKIRNRDVLLDKARIHQYLNIQYQNAVFEGDGVFIGFPTPDGSAGHALQTSSVYAITSKSPAAEGAWAFIESYLSDFSYAGYIANAFPSNKQKLQEEINALINVEYETDREGNLVLDENGNPIPLSGAGGTFSWIDGWSYTYHHETPDELELVSLLLSSARKSDISNGNGVIMQMISEEADAFFMKQKTLDETAEIIQNRVQLYLDESG